MNVLGTIAPQWAVKRARARNLLRQYDAADRRMQKAESKLRGYDAAGRGRRLSTWLATEEGPAGANGRILQILRERSRDLRRNNAYMSNAIENIVSETIGSGIVPRIGRGGSARLRNAWRDWAESTDCDADGRLTYYGIQELAFTSLAESGECLIRLRRRDPSLGLPVPIQLQVMEPDYLADDLAGLGAPQRGNVRAGIAFDRRGKRSGYHLHKQHPSTTGIMGGLNLDTVRVPANEIIHLFRLDRPGQIRGVPWVSPVTTRLRFLDDYEDAALERARVAACFAAFVTDPDELGSPKTKLDADGNEIYPTERLEPGIVEHLSPGKEVTFGTPPADGGYQHTVETNLRAIAGGMHITYEMLTTDLSKVNFTSGRMGALNLTKTVGRWRRNIAIPHLCNGVMRWFTDAARVQGLVGSARVQVAWTAPRSDMVDPTKETAALNQRVRSGFISMPEAIREQGRDPDEVLTEIVEWNEKIDAAGVTLDTDPRNQSAAGQKQGQEDADEPNESGSEDSEDGAGDDGDDAAEAAE